jgi:hypothetical protein
VGLHDGKKLTKSMEESVENIRGYFRFAENNVIEFELRRDVIRGGLTLCTVVNTGIANLYPRAPRCPRKCFRVCVRTFT